MLKGRTILLASTALLVATPAVAQEVPRAAPVDQTTTNDSPNDDIVVTAVARGQNRLDTSVSVSSLDADAIAAAAPRSTAELFRNLPGIRSESSGGEGNANIQSRGIPISTGGAKFLQLQENGLPVLEFGDIAFGNADIFLRADSTVARVEAVRGGSASTFASNSPGGVINLISKTGTTEGGSIQGTLGLDYGEYRIDADYGGKLTDTLTFNIGGFYRVGEGARRAGYDGNKGGQFKGNITKSFPGGFFRLNFKYLNDRAIAYLPSPVRVTGSNGSPNYEALPGLSPQNDTIHSLYFTQAVTLDGQNRRETDDIRDGMHPIVKSVGFEGEFDILDGWTVNDKFRYANISGRFISPFPATVDTVQNLANGVGGAGSVATYANGPSAGQLVANPATTNAIGIVLFNTKLNSLDNFTNDLRLNHRFETGTDSSVDLSFGFYKSRQTINMDWTWSSYLLEAKGDNAALINVRNALGQPQTDTGLIAYGASYFGNCCRRSYNLDFDTSAPFASLTFKSGDLTLDGSVRYDFGQARGFVLGDGPVVPTDVDGNGTISVPETKTTVMPLTATRPINYNYEYLSYSAGANYRIGEDFSVFARYSRGGRANADRFVFGGNTSATSGALLPNARAVDFVRQAEAGMKYQGRGLSLYATAFYARTQEQNYEATTQRSFSNTYRAYGLEVEGAYRVGGFSLAANATLTDAKIVASNDPTVVGNRPRRQAVIVWRVAPEYTSGIFSIGASAVGTGSSYTQDSNQLKLPAFTQVNAFLAIRPIDQLQLSINANNLFNVAGYTEAEEGAIPGNGIVRARSINGRTIAASLKLSFQ